MSRSETGSYVLGQRWKFALHTHSQVEEVEPSVVGQVQDTLQFRLFQSSVKDPAGIGNEADVTQVMVNGTLRSMTCSIQG